MSNRTVSRPPQPRARPKTGGSATSTTYRRQTARLEGRRDGTPLLFGWGKHLTRAQKGRLQQLSLYGFLGLVIVAVIGVLAFGWVQQNLLIPNQTFARVNGVSIPQDNYRKLLAYDAQDLWNRLQSEIKQQNSLATKVQQGDTQATQQNSVLTSSIQADEGAYQQAQITVQASKEIVEDQLIQQAAKTFEQQDSQAQGQLEPTTQAVNDQLKAFKAAFPTNEKYADFVSKNGLSTADITAAIKVHLRRGLMQTYLAKQYVSPTRQVHLRHIETNTAADAQRVLDQIRKGGSWDTLAKQDSLDPQTKATGGDQGWVPQGAGDAGIEIWAYAPNRTVNEISPVLKDSNGTYDVVQIMGIDPSRTIEKSQLDGLKSNALDHWLSGRKVDPQVHLTTPNTTMVNDTRNLPVLPNLNATLPQQSTGASGATGGIPGTSGIPGIPGTTGGTTTQP